MTSLSCNVERNLQVLGLHADTEVKFHEILSLKFQWDFSKFSRLRGPDFRVAVSWAVVEAGTNPAPSELKSATQRLLYRSRCWVSTQV